MAQTQKEIDRRYYLKHKDKVIAKAKVYYQENNEERKAYARTYAKTTEGKETHKRSKKKIQRNNPEKVKARNAARYLPDKICEVDGCDVNGEKHHDDYSKPLDIRYLCTKHHREHHKKERNSE